MAKQASGVSQIEDKKIQIKKLELDCRVEALWFVFKLLFGSNNCWTDAIKLIIEIAFKDMRGLLLPMSLSFYLFLGWFSLRCHKIV